MRHYYVLFLLIQRFKLFSGLNYDPIEYPIDGNPPFRGDLFYRRDFFGKYFVFSKSKYNYNDNFCENYGYAKVFLKTNEDFLTYQKITSEFSRNFKGQYMVE